MDYFPLMESDVVQYEVEKSFTREEGVAAVALKIGQIVAKDANGKYVKVVVASPDDVDGVVISESAEVNGRVAVIANGPVILRGAELDYNGATTAQKTSINAALAKLNIKLN